MVALNIEAKQSPDFSGSIYSTHHLKNLISPKESLHPELFTKFSGQRNCVEKLITNVWDIGETANPLDLEQTNLYRKMKAFEIQIN
ncbi:hypothetical protein L0Z72_09505 [candidate division KSB1 bacterium]|nr:hypothetical protein [candidate division KSB1 bacterium]